METPKEIRCVSYVSFQPIFYLIYVLYIHIYIYIIIYMFLLWGSSTIIFRFQVCRILRDSEDQLRELKEHAVVLASARGDLSIMGLLLKLAMRRDMREMYGWRKQQKNMEMLFWVQGVWDGVKLGENLMCGRVVTFLCWRWLAGRNLICVWRWMGHPTIISYNFIYVRYPWSSSQASSCQYLEDEGMLNIQFHPNDFASQWARCHFC